MKKSLFNNLDVFFFFSSSLTIFVVDSKEMFVARDLFLCRFNRCHLSDRWHCRSRRSQERFRLFFSLVFPIRLHWLTASRVADNNSVRNEKRILCSQNNSAERSFQSYDNVYGKIPTRIYEAENYYSNDARRYIDWFSHYPIASLQRFFI